LRTAFGGVLEAVQGRGYWQWFLLMAFLHPVAWLMLKVGQVDRVTNCPG